MDQVVEYLDVLGCRKDAVVSVALDFDIVYRGTVAGFDPDPMEVVKYRTAADFYVIDLL